MHVHTGIKICSLSSYIAIANKVACARSKHDDQDDNIVNTLAFMNFLLVNIFPILIRQIFPLSKFCAI